MRPAIYEEVATTMTSKQVHRIPKPIQVSLNALLREFTRCSNRYFPLFHERFVPTGNLASHSNDDVCRAFRNANGEHFGDGWEEWDGPESPCSLERFYGYEDGLCEFRQLGDSIQLIVRELDPSRPDTGYLGWLDFLYEMAHGYPTPLLRCTVNRWNERAIEDWSGDQPDSTGSHDNVQIPLFPLHFALSNNLFTSSVSAVELMLDDEGALLVGEWTGGFPISFPSENHEGILDPNKFIDFSEEELQGPIKSFAFLEKIERWALRHQLGNEVADVTFEYRSGYEILDVLFRHPNEWHSASRLLQLAGVADVPTPKDEAAMNSGNAGTDLLDDAAISAYKKRIATINEDLPATVNSERRRELKSERQSIQATLKKDTDQRGKSRKFTDTTTDAPVKLIQTQLIRCRTHISKYIPQFTTFMKTCCRRDGGQWIYEPDRWKSS